MPESPGGRADCTTRTGAATLPAVSSDSELALAAQHDAAGQYDEAINVLARGTGAGDAACTQLLGVRLLTGDRAPHLPAEGLGFIAEACAKGFGEGAARSG